MPPPGYEPFLRAIRENPEDDTVRLVYADWLDENGDPDRAEFIRVSIDWSRTGHASEQWNLLRDRVVGMVKLHQKRWLGELPEAGVSWDTGFPWGPFDRGFPATVAVLHGQPFADRAEELFSLAPIQHLVFPRVSFALIVRALACPAVAGISGFSIVRTSPNPPGDELCELLARPDHLFRLEVLALRQLGITDTGLAALSRARFLPRVRLLLLDGNPAGEGGLMAVVDRLSPQIVQRLALPAAPLGEESRRLLRERFGPQLGLV